MSQKTDDRLKDCGLALMGLVSRAVSANVCIVGAVIDYMGDFKRKPMTCCAIDENMVDSCLDCAHKHGLEQIGISR